MTSSEAAPRVLFLTPGCFDKGGISPAQPRPATEAQESVLGLMRQSLRRTGAAAS